MNEGKIIVIAEGKFGDFFKKPDRFEASDVIYRDGFLYVVFDNLYQIAKIRADLNPDKEGNELLGKSRKKDSGYEGITVNQESRRFYTLIECLKYRDRTYRAKVHEYDRDFKRNTNDRVFVASQESSSLWIGTQKERQWAFEGERTIYKFPTKEGHALYCNIEGVCDIPAAAFIGKLNVDTLG